MSEDDLDQELTDIQAQVGGWFDEFVLSPQYEALTEIQKDHASAIVQFFTEYSFRHVGERPKEWSRNGLTECCVEILPRKITAKRSFFEAVAPVLSAFFTFLAEKGLLTHGRDLAETAAELGEEIVAESQDKRKWGPAKTFMMAAEEAGVDPHDKRALDRFMIEFNSRLLAGMQTQQPTQQPTQVRLAPALAAPAPPIRHSQPKPGRNDPCPCGSGRKFKKCCGA